MAASGFFTSMDSAKTRVTIGSAFSIGSHAISGSLINPFSGSVQEYRVWTEKLSKNTIVTQSLSPFNYDGNSISSSFEKLIQRVPIGSDYNNIISGDINNAPNKSFRNLYSASISDGVNTIISSIISQSCKSGTTTVIIIYRCTSSFAMTCNGNIIIRCTY